MKKISTLLLSVLLLCLFNKINAQAKGFADHFNGSHAGNWTTVGGVPANVHVDYSSGVDVKVTGTANEVFAAYSAAFFPTSVGFDIKFAPYIKFDAKSVNGLAKTVALSMNGSYTDNSNWSLSKNINMTGSYQTFFYDLTSDLASKETGGKIVQNVYEIWWNLAAGMGAPYPDDAGFYLDNVLLGDSANPCPNKRPTTDAINVWPSLNFNSVLGYDLNISGISDGNGSTKLPITVTVKSSDETIIATPAVTYTSPDATAAIKVMGAQPPKNGSAHVLVTIGDTSFCNSSITKDITVTVKPESLWFALPQPTTITVNPASGEQTVYISSITNIGKSAGGSPLQPDNYRGLTFTAKAVSNGTMLTSFTDAMPIDSAGGGAAQFKFTVSPDAMDKAVIKINFILTSATGKVTVPGAAKNPPATLTINVSKTDLASETADLLNVYPNPASDLINVVLPAGAEKIDVVNDGGVIVKSVSVKGQSGTVGVSIAGLASGTYIINAGSAKASIMVK